jgi:general secretion pathway protein E
MSASHKYFGEICLEKSLVSKEQLAKALASQKEKGGRLGELLEHMKFLAPLKKYEVLSEQLGLEFFPRLLDQQIDPELSKNLPITFVKQYQFLPLRKENGKVLVASADPVNYYPLEDLARLMSAELKVVVTPAEEILAAINRIYDRLGQSAESVVENLSREGEDLSLLAQGIEEPTDLLEASEEAPIIRFVNSLLYQAVKERASDIHIEPFEKEVLVRYRIDGVLYEVLRAPKRLQSSIISRVKIMGGLNIAEKRLPQDGRIRIKIAGKDIDIRLSTLPTAFGERTVMRLLDRSQVLLQLDDLGFARENLEQMNDLIHHSHGIILVTGPTGSGKTTTLYAALQKINTPDKNIITIEDPIEYQLPGIGQIQVNPKINLTFANGLRSIVRQDPDVILVGEIRDSETAEIAIQASLTGHLVFSTLHTNDAPSATTRLIDMGIEPFLISSSTLAILAQRLVRVLCRECRVPAEPDAQILKDLEGERWLKGATFFNPAGCPKCLNTGYIGRSGIYELMIIDDEIRNMINRRADSNELKQLAQKKGMLTLREDALRKAAEGITSLDEVLRVTQEDIS